MSRVVRRVPSRALTRMAAHLQTETVLIDFGPSSSALNKVMVMSCDIILPVCLADEFCVHSAHVMFRYVFPDWIKWSNNQKRNKSSSPASVPHSAVHATTRKVCTRNRALRATVQRHGTRSQCASDPVHRSRKRIRGFCAVYQVKQTVFHLQCSKR